MHNPRPSVVGFESDDNVIIGAVAGVDYIATDRILVVISGASGTPDDGESMSMKMDRVLEVRSESNHQSEQREILTGAPSEPPGMVISITLLGGKVYTDPFGMRSCAVCAPLRIWRRTGTVGGLNVALFTENCSVSKLKVIL